MFKARKVISELKQNSKIYITRTYGIILQFQRGHIDFYVRVKRVIVSPE